MMVSVIIPVYNEEKTFLELLNKVKKTNIKKEIIIVNDGSKDKTKEILQKIKDPNITIINHERNQGKGTAIRTGLNKAIGDIIIIQDADLEYDPSDYERLIAPIVKGEASVVYGTRMFSLSKKDMHTLHYYGNRVLTLITNMIFRSKLSDMETCYKVFKKDVIKNINPLRAKRFDIEPELTAKFLKNGYKIYEVPIKFNPRTFKEGKKITWLDGLKALYYLVKYRFFD